MIAGGVQMPRVFRTQLVDGQPVFLTRTRERRGREHFVKASPEAWRLLPEEVTDAIVRYWKDGQTSQFNPYWPMIELVPDLDGKPGILGRCTNGGYELYFVSPAVKKMPSRVVHGLILHELHSCLLLGDGPHL
jgi:hypothetical protein